jgi:hypothetical protein
VRYATTASDNFDKDVANISEFAAQRGYNLLTIVCEMGVTAFDTKPLLEDLIGHIADGTYLCVITPNLEHLGLPPSLARQTLKRLKDAGARVDVLQSR